MLVASEYDKASCYVAAHADDWQLFMFPDVFRDIRDPNTRVMIIVVTAGDAGFDKKFAEARERGAKSSVEYCIAPFRKVSSKEERIHLCGSEINVWNANNVSLVFLRLPDGNLDGNGFPGTGFQSLSKLKRRQLHSLQALDGSIACTWEQFLHLLGELVMSLCEIVEEVELHYLSPEREPEVFDHPDHTVVGEALRELSLPPQVKHVLHTGYQEQEAQRCLTGEEIFWKAGLFAVYEKTVYDLTGYSTLAENPETYMKWCCR